MESNFVTRARQLFPESAVYRNNNCPTLVVSYTEILPVIRILRDHTSFRRKVLSDRTAVDYPGNNDHRFQLAYSLLSVDWNTRRRVKTFVAEGSPIDSITSIHPSANWYEREVYDRFGVWFQGHPDRRRILTDYGFEGHPLRKDFPLTGFTEVRYDEAQKRVVQDLVEGVAG